jgi:hypothetical protein
MIFLGILLGFILGLIILQYTGFIEWKKKTVVEKYIRRGILQKDFTITDRITGQVSTISVQYEIGELESTDKLSKIEVIFLTLNQSEYLTDSYKNKLTNLVDKSWVESIDINWITTISDTRNRKIDEILN